MTEEDFILGRTFIRTYEKTIDLVNRQMVIKNSNPIPVPTVPEDAPEIALILEEPMEIAHGQISICKLRLGDKIVKTKSDVMVWSNVSSGISVGWTLSTVDEDFCVYASVLNSTGSSLLLEKGQSMARCASVEVKLLVGATPCCETNSTETFSFDKDVVSFEKVNSSTSSYSSSRSPTDILSDKSEFPTDGLREESKPLILPAISQLAEKLNPKDYK